MKNLLLTGRPGVGKTTIVREVLKELKDRKVGGFCTEEVRNSKGIRVGFKIRTVDGQEGVLAQVDVVSSIKVGRYGVNVEAIENVINPSIENALIESDFIVIDEVGKIEIASRRFKELVKQALDSPQKVLATVPIYRLSFVESLKCRTDVVLGEVTIKNRDLWPWKILEDWKLRCKKLY
jgi:nucleoside-triphosphatase